jgi:hypothetical protein
MKYIIFIVIFFGLNLKKENVNYICKNDDQVIFFKKVNQSYLYLDKYDYLIEKIGFFNCKNDNCILQEVKSNKTITSSKLFFKDCIQK